MRLERKVILQNDVFGEKSLFYSSSRATTRDLQIDSSLKIVRNRVVVGHDVCKSWNKVQF